MNFINGVLNYESNWIVSDWITCSQEQDNYCKEDSISYSALSKGRLIDCHKVNFASGGPRVLVMYAATTRRFRAGLVTQTPRRCLKLPNSGNAASITLICISCTPLRYAPHDYCTIANIAI